MKRYRNIKAKPGQLKVQYGKLPYDEPDLIFAWGDGTNKADSHLLMNALHEERYHPFDKSWSPGVVDELEKRGYDITTLKISIEKKKE